MPSMDAGLDFDHCYRALTARDAHFDGLFYTAVKTTGIYCRPVCPARTPARTSCTFFGTAAAAERAGFRPCLRCRPELSPGRPDFHATLAQSIYQRIAAGALDRGSLDQLADEIGVSTRHMRRLLLEHFGVTPVQIAQTQRLLFAKKLLHETQLPMTEVALASGFGSVRRFNAAFLESYHLAPSALRRVIKSDALAGDTVSLRLHYRPPFDASYWFAYLGARAIEGIEYGDATLYRRTLRETQGASVYTGWFEVRADQSRDALVVTVPRELTAVLLPLMLRIRRVFDLDADPRQIASHLAQSPILASAGLTENRCRVPGAWDPFELMLRAVLGQQVSVRGASTLAGRIAARYCLPLQNAPQGLRFQPLLASRLAMGPSEELAKIGLPMARAKTLIAIARFAAERKMEFLPGTPLTEMISRLSTIDGIGDWTAHYVAMRAYAYADAFPSGDLGLRKAVAKVQGEFTTLPSSRELEQQSHAWRPWRAYAASVLWASLHEEKS